MFVVIRYITSHIIKKDEKMARPGITYQDVANAAQEIFAQGQNPTIETIRHRLGTGSSTTIAMHLKTWKNKQHESEQFIGKEKLPDELVASLKGLWTQIVMQAEDQIEVIKLEARREINVLDEHLKTIEEAKIRWEEEAKQLAQEKLSLSNDKLMLEQATVELQKQIALADSQIQALKQQLEDKQERVNELHRLHSQTQANLEHYRQSTREQRLIEQQQHEQQKQQLEQTIHQLQQTSIAYANEKSLLQQKYEKLCFENEATLAEFSKSKVMLTKSQEDIAELEKKLIESSGAKQYWQEQCQGLQVKLEAETKDGLTLQKELAANQQLLNSTEKQLQDANEQNKALALEKWEFAQEKAKLEGRLKQVELMLGKKALEVVG